MKRLILACATSALMSTAAYADDVTLELWTWYPSETVLTKIIDAFEDENPGVNVNLNLFESGAYQDRMPLALASGDPMDVVAVQTSTMVNLVKDGLQPLAPLFDEHGSASIDSLISPSALTQAQSLASDDDLYIAPLGVLGSAAVYYNADLLEELSLTIPRTRDELATFVASVTEQRPDLLPISFTGANWFLDEIALTVAEQAGTGFFNSVRYNTGGRWDDPAYVAAFDAVVSAYSDGLFSKDTLDLDYGRSAELFQQGQAVAFMQGTWESGLLSEPHRTSNTIPLNNVVASGLPVLVEGGSPSIRSFIEVGLAVPEQAKNPELSVKFIEFMAAGGGVEAWSDTLFVVPAAVGFELADGIFNSEAAEASYDEIANLLLNPGSDRNNVSDFSAAAGDALISAILNGDSTAEKTAHLQSEWESGRYSNSE